MVELLAASGDLIGEPRAITHPVKFYERGDRPLEIVTSRQWFIRNGGRDEAAAPGSARPGRGARLAPALHAGPVRGLGERPQQRLARQPPALLRRADPDLVPARRPTASPTTTHPSCPTRPACPSTPRPTRHPATGRASAASRAASSVTPTSWTRGPPRRSPRRSPAGGRTTRTSSRRLSPWTCGPRATRSSAPGSSRPSCAPHLEHHVLPWRHTHPQRLGPRPRAQEDVQVQGQRGHPHAAGGGVRFRRRALLGLQRPPGHRHRGRHRRHEDRPPPGHQDPQRLEVRAGAPRRGRATGRRGGARAARPRPAGPAGRGGDDRDGVVRAVRLRPCPGGHRDLLLVVLRRLPRAGQDEGVRGGRPRRRRLGPGHPGAGPLGPDPALRPLAPLRDRGGVELVAGGLGPPRPVARRRRDRRRTPTRTGTC